MALDWYSLGQGNGWKSLKLLRQPKLLNPQACSLASFTRLLLFRKDIGIGALGAGRGPKLKRHAACGPASSGGVTGDLCDLSYTPRGFLQSKQVAQVCFHSTHSGPAFSTMLARLCFNAITLAALAAAAPGLRGLTNTTNGTAQAAQRSATGCDCSWIANDDCINQDSCAVSCRQSHGSPCTAQGPGPSSGGSDAACQASCDSSYGSCNRWCHIPPGGGPYYTEEEEEALKGQILQCEGKCTVTRGTCYESCR